MPFTSRGTRVPGAPVGSDEFCVNFARERVAEVTGDTAAIGRMPSLQAQHCLLQGAIQHRLNHLWRGIPGGELSLHHGLMTDYVELLLSIPRRKALALPSAATFLVGLSPARGGLGYRFWENTADCAFLASYINPSTTSPTLFQDLAILFPPSLSLVQRGAVPPLRPVRQVRFRIDTLAPLAGARLSPTAGRLLHCHDR